MCSTIEIYQTLKNKRAYSILRDGPFKCERSDAWMGAGYYFWEAFVDNAHWWGRKSCNNNYIITQGICDYPYDKCLDLIGNTYHIKEFNEYLKIFEENPKTSKFCVSQAITVLRLSNKNFCEKYEAIRVYPVNSVSTENENSKRLKFISQKPQYLDCNPAFQLCLFHKRALGFRDYKIIHTTDNDSQYIL